MPDQPIDISQLAQPPEAEPKPQAEPQPTPEEVYQIKYRGEVQEVPRSVIDALAPALGTTPDGVINAFQRAREADRIARDKIRLEQELETLRAQQDGARYQERMGGGQPPMPSQGTPGYGPPPYEPQRYAYPSAEPEDPMVYLRRLDAGLQATQRQIQEFTQTAQRQQALVEQQANEARWQQQAQEISAQAERYLATVNKGRKEPVVLEDFLQEVELSGGGNRHLPLESAFDRAWTYMTRDERDQQVQAELITKLRSPNARVVVPGTQSVTPTPPRTPQQQTEDALGQFKVGDIIDYVPKRMI